MVLQVERVDSVVSCNACSSEMLLAVDSGNVWLQLLSSKLTVSLISEVTQSFVAKLGLRETFCLLNWTAYSGKNHYLKFMRIHE